MWIARARPLLGTVVSIQIKTRSTNLALAERAICDAFSIIAHIGRVMSAHQHDSDLGKISRAHSGEVLALDAATIAVIRSAQHWYALSHGAFNPCLAAQTLSRLNRRPGIACDATGTLQDIHVMSDTTARFAQAVNLDFGGIAKGYAVDRAIETLAGHGISDALVNAGGDLRSMGERKWPIDVRHANAKLINGRLNQRTQLCQKALATSVSGALNPEFILMQRHKKFAWTSVTVQADTCLVADVLTKWAIQSSLLCPNLRVVLRQNHARMLRTP